MIRHFFIFSLILAIPTATTVAFIPSPRFRDDSHRQRGSGEVPDHYHIEDDPPPGMTAPSVTRRDILERGGNHAAAVWMTTTAAGPVAAAVPTPALTATTTTTTTTITPNTGSTKGDTNLLADLPMVRLKLPPGGLGREYLALRVRVGHHGPYTFMVDTGLTTELITPHLREQLSVPSPTTETSASTTTGDRSSSSPKTTIRGLAAGGVTNNPLVELRDVAIVAAGGEGGGFGDEQRIPVPGVLHAVVTDFPQEHMDPAHDPVEGMVGMEALRMFDVDLDFPAERIRLYKPGTVGTTGVATRARLVKIPAVIINETGLLGIRVTTATATATATTTTTTTTTSHSTETIQSQQQQQQQQQQQPILGVLDCGATFSVINTAATRYMGLPSDTRNDPLYKRNPVVAGVGIDGRPITLSSAPTKFTFVGDVISDPTTGRPTGFGPPPPIWEPWDMVSVAVGDIPAFSTILGDGVTPYQGPVALIGLDVLAQRRVVLESVPPNSPTRNRRVWVSPK